MAGYLFGLDSIESLEECIELGIYSTRISSPTSEVWKAHQEGTFADYSSMQAGDNVYFFIKRKIYGIGKLINISNDCKFLNYPDADAPLDKQYAQIQSTLLYDYGEESVNFRFICVFEPSPMFFRNGIDMDDVLASSPTRFKILRTFWKLSFIKFSDEENQAFKDIILQRNYKFILNPLPESVYDSNYLQTHENLNEKLALGNYSLKISPFLDTISDGKYIRHEMAIEAALIFQISRLHDETIAVFGRWDFISHQVVASPFKPVDYMDKMDIFGYSYIEDQRPTIAKYLVIELKKANAFEQDLLQLMKYIDWVKEEYSLGDYTRIEGFLVAFDFEHECINNLKKNVERNFIYGVRPSIPDTWRNVKLVKYSYNEHTELLDFEIIADANE
ncbi:MAG TPA: hypothetical protein VHB70_08235 [Parafilimonas sp.]|nr:hypothetical protein [Parafilimonas sp.]